MALLRKAVDAGYRNAAALRTEKALDAFRNRDGFKTLMAELVKKPTAKPETAPCTRRRCDD